jgi:hypothetical protein
MRKTRIRLIAARKEGGALTRIAAKNWKLVQRAPLDSYPKSKIPCTDEHDLGVSEIDQRQWLSGFPTAGLLDGDAVI